MTLKYPQTWEFIRQCVENKQEHLLKDFMYHVGEGNYRRTAKHIDWAFERNYSHRGKNIPKGDFRPIEICLTMPSDGRPNGWCPPMFVWEDDTFFSKEFTMEPILKFDI